MPNAKGMTNAQCPLAFPLALRDCVVIEQRERKKGQTAELQIFRMCTFGVGGFNLNFGVWISFEP
jgi:hypothetical protein